MAGGKSPKKNKPKSSGKVNKKNSCEESSSRQVTLQTHWKRNGESSDSESEIVLHKKSKTSNEDLPLKPSSPVNLMDLLMMNDKENAKLKAAIEKKNRSKEKKEGDQSNEKDRRDTNEFGERDRRTMNESGEKDRRVTKPDEKVNDSNGKSNSSGQLVLKTGDSSEMNSTNLPNKLCSFEVQTPLGDSVSE